MAQDLNPLAVSRFTDNPNSTARRKKLDGQVLPQIGVFASGNRTRTAELASGDSLTVSNHPCLSDNLQLSAHRNWSGSRDSHPDRRVHNAECCCYTTILI
jgi:hypothetical protein